MFGAIIAALFSGGLLGYSVGRGAPAQVIVTADASRWLLRLGALEGEVRRNGANWAWTVTRMGTALLSGSEATLRDALRQAVAQATTAALIGPGDPIYMRRADDAVVGAVEPAQLGGWAWMLRARGRDDAGGSDAQRGPAVLALVDGIARLA